MSPSVTPFLMFDGRAEEALNFYVSLFSNAQIGAIEKYGPDEAGAEGSVKKAGFVLNGQGFLCIDSPVKHGFTFTPAISLFVDCDSEAEIDHLFEHLATDGEVLMPLDGYPFSRKFGWVSDRFGVSWQLNLAAAEVVSDR